MLPFSIKHWQANYTGHLFIFYHTFFEQNLSNIKLLVIYLFSTVPFLENLSTSQSHVYTHWLGIPILLESMWKLKIPITSEQAQAKWSLIAKKLTENGFLFILWLASKFCWDYRIQWIHWPQVLFNGINHPSFCH